MYDTLLNTVDMQKKRSNVTKKKFGSESKTKQNDRNVNAECVCKKCGLRCLLKYSHSSDSILFLNSFNLF